MAANAQAASTFVNGQGRRDMSARRLLVLGLSLLLPLQPASAASNKVRLSSLADISFGTISDVTSDAIQSESVCMYADTNTNGYNVTASGSGPGNAFQLASGLNSLTYEVQWNSSAGQSSGAQLSSGAPLNGQTSAATQQTCNNGPATSASLILIMRAAVLASAPAGSYKGTLTLVVGPE